MDAILDWLFKWVMGPIVILLMVALGIGVLCVPFAIYQAATSPPAKHFTLRADTWECTAKERYWAGKFYSVRCAEYSRKP